MNITQYSVSRRAAIFLSTVAMVALVAATSAPGALAQDDKQHLDTRIDERLGLFEQPLRIWKLPLRYTASLSPYFRPGVPPYRQQPETAQELALPKEAGPEPSTTPTPSTSGSPDGDSTASTGDSGSGGGSSSSSSSSGSSTPTLTLIEPLPTFTPVLPPGGSTPMPTPTPTPSAP